VKLGTWLLALVEPMLGKILVSLGFSVVTITGVDVAVNALKDQAVAGISALSPAAYNLFLLSGGGIGLGIVLGACATRLMLWQLQNATKILSANPS
jgi:hypothetical protein